MVLLLYSSICVSRTVRQSGWQVNQSETTSSFPHDESAAGERASEPPKVELQPLPSSPEVVGPNKGERPPYSLSGRRRRERSPTRRKEAFYREKRE